MPCSCGKNNCGHQQFLWDLNSTGAFVGGPPLLEPGLARMLLAEEGRERLARIFKEALEEIIAGNEMTSQDESR